MSIDIQKIISNKHSNYQDKIDLMNCLKTHATGVVPEKLINERRPSESKEVKDYREKIYVAKTKNPIFKVIHSLEKIRRSEDWVIQYNREDIPKAIADDETLERYCEYRYPVHTSITNWAFSELLKQYLIDANGIVAVLPMSLPEQSNEYIEPMAYFFDSTQVYDYKENEYLLLKSLDTSEYATPSGRFTRQSGDVYWLLTREKVVRYEQSDSRGTLVATLEYEHCFGRIPATKVGGVFLKRKNNETIYESRIASMVPCLDEAAREYSDLQAEIVQHIHSEKYAYTNTECPKCKGTGVIQDKDNHRSECKECRGTGSVANVSPYGMHLIRVADTKAEQPTLPTPPIGYIQKSSDMARLQDERVGKHIYEALSTVNMEFLAHTPLNQSGIAKEVDRDELNNFVNSVAEDIVRILDVVYYFINEYRYSVILPDKEKRKLMLPMINVPTKYDILKSEHLLSAIDLAKKSNVNSVILRELEVEYAKKRFNTNSRVSYEVQAVIELDPLYGMSVDEKMSYKSNGGVRDIDYIISCNIGSLVRKAVEQYKNFYQLEMSKKRDIIEKLAEEIREDFSKMLIES